MDSESVTVEVPARRERELDMAEFGQLSRILRRRFGLAAMRAGDPDLDPDDLVESAARTVANVLWVLPRDFEQAVLERAVEHRNAWPPKP